MKNVDHLQDGATDSSEIRIIFQGIGLEISNLERGKADPQVAASRLKDLTCRLQGEVGKVIK